MHLTSTSLKHNTQISEKFAFGIPDANDHMQLGPNHNPQLSWSGLPANTKSLVLICNDPDAPSSAEDVNQENKIIPVDFPRADFTHWAVVDISPSDDSITEGECSNNVTVGGKSSPAGPAGSRQGLNDYTGFLAGNPDMRGEYFGYDGPCPPWNDARLHHYQFILYATDLETCPVKDKFTGADVRKAIEGHVLDEASIVCSYSLNADLG